MKFGAIVDRMQLWLVMRIGANDKLRNEGATGNFNDPMFPTSQKNRFG